MGRFKKPRWFKMRHVHDKPLSTDNSGLDKAHPKMKAKRERKVQYICEMLMNSDCSTAKHLVGHYLKDSRPGKGMTCLVYLCSPAKTRMDLKNYR